MLICLMLHNSRPHAYQGYERSQDMYDSFVKSQIAVCDEVKRDNGKQIYLKEQNNHHDALKYKRKQDVLESLVNLRESVSISLSTESQFKESLGENISLNLNEDVFCSVDDDGDSGIERHVDEWSNTYISERKWVKNKNITEKKTRGRCK